MTPMPLVTAPVGISPDDALALLAHQIGWRLTEGWIVLSLGLYACGQKPAPAEEAEASAAAAPAAGEIQAMRVTSEADAALGVAAMEVLASERWKPAFVRGVAVDAPFRVEALDVLAVGVLSILWSFLAASIPARTAARLSPVEALRGA